jgi:hypothetical protein
MTAVVRVPGYRSRGPRFDSRRYQFFWEVVGLERGPLSLVRIIKELLERKVAALGYKTEINGRGDSWRWPRDTLYPLKLALSSPTSSGRSVGIVRLRTQATEFDFLFGFLRIPDDGQSPKFILIICCSFFVALATWGYIMILTRKATTSQAKN